MVSPCFSNRKKPITNPRSDKSRDWVRVVAHQIGPRTSVDARLRSGRMASENSLDYSRFCEERTIIVDAVAHVVETEHTWDFLDEAEKKFRPQLFSSTENPNMRYWFVHGKSVGVRLPTLTEQELIALSKEADRELKTAPEASELRVVQLRLKHMVKLGI